MIEFNPIELQFSSTTLKVCFAQLIGPAPKGKKEIFIQGRQTYEWESKDEVDERIAKVRSILSFISERHESVDIIVFPEYSAPSVYLDDDYRECANNLNCMIIGSPDNFHDGGKIYNKTPIYLPNREQPIWLVKRHMSQWEAGYIDEPGNIRNPIFYWQVGGKKYWISIHVCLDFLFSLDEHDPPKEDPALMIVTMCSPEIMTFNNFADTHFIHPGGRAVILCNCTGSAFAGRSAVFAETPGGAKFTPAFFIRDKREAVAIVEIDCEKFKLPRKSTTTTKSCMGQILQYKLEKNQNTYLLTETQQATSASKVRAVINPNLYEVFGKKIRISFLGIGQYGKMDEQKLKDSGLEIYSLLGNNDLMVSHLNSSISSLISEINQLLPSWHTGAIKEGDSSDYSTFPYFEVSRYYKVLGTIVGDEANRAFLNSIPDENELMDLLRLGKDWETPSISEDRKTQFSKKNWLLGKTEMIPGEINVIMTVRLTSPEKDSDIAWRDFNLRILPFLLDNVIVTSIYEGTNNRANINYLLRIKTRVEDLFQFLSEVHALGLREDVLFTTNTYVIVNKWSSLSLERSLPLSGLARHDEYFRESIVMPMLENSADKSKFKNLGSSQQSYIINRVREIQRLLDEPYSKGSDSMQKEKNKKMLPEILYGIFLQDLKRLRFSHDEFQNSVEGLIGDILQLSSEEEFVVIREELGYKGKEKNRLTYFEKVHVAIKVVRNRRLDLLSEFEESCKDLIDSTVSTRNAFAHNDYERTSIESYCKAMQSYAEFLKNWSDVAF